MVIKAATPLERRMRLHVGGQITWPEPALGKYCTACRFYYTGDTKNTDKGCCDLVKLHGKVLGKAFCGADAIACPQFDAGKHVGNKK